jgi:ribosomal protein S18 acetylase RimI-like enzyme
MTSAPDNAAETRLRAMERADLADVLALELELFPEDPWTAEMFAGEIAQPPESRLYVLAEADADDARVDSRDIESRDSG